MPRPPVSDSQVFTVEDSSCIEEPIDMGPCTQVWWRALKEQLGQSVSVNRDCSDNNVSFEDVIKGTYIKRFTAAEIKKATSNYSKINIIGKGGYGTVFKGILPNNQVIAIKRFDPNYSLHSDNSFSNEIIVLSQINNKNVVKLLGYCFETNLYCIVFEYLPNGTLHDHLFDPQKACLLTWNHRLRIAAQVAQVLEYLHTTVRVPIIHRDVKPSNILLDDKYMPKVSDFGNSKAVHDEYELNTLSVVEDIWESNGDISTLVMGTFGYIDPEYYSTSSLTKKSDVYSFGVVLVQLLTTQKAISYADEFKGDRRLLVSRFLEKLDNGCSVEILDLNLVNKESIEQLKKVGHLAGRCLELKGDDRPTMRQVVRELQDIRGF